MKNVLFEAKEPTTTPERLTELASHPDVAVRRAIAQNPQTPLSVLLALGEVFPEQIVRNPALLNALQENTEPFRQMPTATALMLLTLESLPEPLWLSLALHPNRVVWRAVFSHPSLPASVLVAVEHLDQYRQWAIAQHPNTPKDVIERLEAHKDSGVRFSAAQNPNAPEACLEQLSGDSAEIVREGVAQNPKAPPALLERLGTDEYNSVRWRVAQNPGIPEPLLLRMIFDRVAFVYCAAIGHKALPASALVELSTDERPGVQEEVARNPNTPVSCLAVLAKSTNPQVLRALRENPNTPREILESLLPSPKGASPQAWKLPKDARLFYSGQNFSIYKTTWEGKACCVKVPAGEAHRGVFQARRAVGGVSTSWDLMCWGGSLPHSVERVSVDWLLQNEAERIQASRGEWNHHVLAQLEVEIDGQSRTGLLTEWHEGDTFASLPRASQRELFPRMLPAFWRALSSARHGDLHPGNVILSPARERFHLIDPGASVFYDQGKDGACSSKTYVSFITNAEHYPLLPPYYAPSFKLERGDSLRGHWEHWKQTLLLSHVSPAQQTVYQNVLMRTINPRSANPLEEAPITEPNPADLLALGVMYYQALTGKTPFPLLTQPAWSQISSVDDRLIGGELATRQLQQGIQPPRTLASDITEPEENLSMALLDLQAPSLGHLAQLALEAAASLPHNH